MINIEEYLLSIDKFQTPKILKDKDAIFVLLIRLMLLEKGTIQSHPDMGVGIISRYRYSDEDKLQDLQLDIVNQINTYLPKLVGVDVKVSGDPVNKEILVSISVNGVLYTFSTDSNNKTLQLVDL